MSDMLLGFIAGVALFALLGAYALDTQEINWQQDAITRGYAIHCPNDGNFAWKGECDD